MKKPDNSNTAKPAQSNLVRRLLLFIINYTILLVLFILFAFQIIHRIGEGRLEYLNIIIPVALLIPMALLVLIIINIIRLARDLRNRVPGSRLKRRLIIFFVIIILLSTTPITLISIYTVVTTYDSWYSPEIGSALNSGLYISLIYYHDQLDNLTKIPNTRIFHTIIKEVDSNPENVWQNLSDINPWIHGLQINSTKGDYFFGDELCQQPVDMLKDYQSGILPKKKVSGNSLLSYLHRFRSKDIEYTLVLSTLLPKDFDSEAENLTRAVERYESFNRLYPYIEMVTVSLFLFFLMPMILLSILLAVLMSDRIITPLTEMASAIKKVADGDFSFRLLNQQDDDFYFFSRTFNTMVNELQKSRSSQLLTEKVTTWQEIARRLAHELKNPLTPIKLTSQRIARKAEKREQNEFNQLLITSMKTITNQVEQLDLMLQDFRHFADDRQPKKELRTISLFIKDLIILYNSSYPGMDLKIHNHCSEDIKLSFDVHLLTQVFHNLIKNSIDACEEKGTIDIHIDLIQKGYSFFCRLQFKDSGSGIPKDKLEQLFDPYFTTKPDGLGLGLPIVERIITAHGGQIWVESAENSGTSFFIDLPYNEEKEA